MTKPVIEKTEEAALAAEFSDELSDEALDRRDESFYCNRGTKGCTGGDR
jgi:hypothetical protein